MNYYEYYIAYFDNENRLTSLFGFHTKEDAEEYSKVYKTMPFMEIRQELIKITRLGRETIKEF